MLVLILTLLLATITGCSKVDPVEGLLESDQLGYYTDDLSDIQFTENKVDHVVDEENKKIYILDYQIIDSILGNKRVTVDDVYKSIDKNQNIPDDYKEQFKAFTKAMDEYYGACFITKPDLMKSIFQITDEELAATVESAKEFYC